MFRAADGDLHQTQFLASAVQRLKQQRVWAELSSAAQPPCPTGQASLSLCLSWSSPSCCLPSSLFGFGSCRPLTNCLCFVCRGLQELTARWLLPECPFGFGLLLPLVLPGMQDSSSGARSEEPWRQTRLLEELFGYQGYRPVRV